MTADLRGRWWAGLAVGVVGTALGGAGFLNGDAAAYAAQGWAGDALARPVHALWGGLAVAVAPWVGDALPRALDTITAWAGGGLVVASGARGAQVWVVAAFVLPWCAFGEVDLLWMALVAASSRVGPRWGAGILSALAVATSPTALLALPWVTRVRRDGAAVAGGGSMVLALSLVSAGEWWFGHRGVLGTELLLGRTLGAWVGSGLLVAVPLALARDDRDLPWLLPLVLAPPDVPTWVMVGTVAARSWPASGSWSRGLAAAAVTAGLAGLLLRRVRVADEADALHAIASSHREGLGYEGPWSWGTRLSVLATRRTDGLPFRPMRPLRDGRWPAPAVEQVGLLPPGRVPDPSRPLLRVDEEGVHWVAPWWLPDG